MQKRYRIQFPRTETYNLNQDEAYFFLQEEKTRKLRFHDYAEIYENPGLYEQVFYERLKCSSPSKVTSILKSSINQTKDDFSTLRVLDLGAGNGMVGEELKKHGVSRLIGVDIIPQAYKALVRDRPGIYDAYYVADFCQLNTDIKEDISSWQCNCMMTVAALGFGDIPVGAFIEAFNIIKNEGWVAFNIKETFLDNSDKTGFSKMVRELIFSEYMDVYHMERYQHRLSIEGQPLYYFAIVGRKNADVSKDFLISANIF